MKTNIKKAVALAYGYNEDIPKIVASGYNKSALFIVEKAKKLNIPIFQNKELVESLIKLNLDDEIHEENYLSVAKILIWLSNNEDRSKLSYQNSINDSFKL